MTTSSDPVPPIHEGATVYAVDNGRLVVIPMKVAHRVWNGQGAELHLQVVNSGQPDIDLDYAHWDLYFKKVWEYEVDKNCHVWTDYLSALSFCRHTASKRIAELEQQLKNLRVIRHRIRNEWNEHLEAHSKHLPTAPEIMN